MNYQETINYLFSQLPMYQRNGTAAYKKNIGNIIKACQLLENPQNKIKCIHIAGTNGKGSTAHLIASILQEAGFKTGLYTSPHLKDFRERIKINGKSISKENVIEFVKNNRQNFKEINMSFFEYTVAMAFHQFCKYNVDISVIETGLGGRLDSTNIINPEVTVITNIGLDHMNLLGDTLEKITREKAGIIKKNTPLIIGRRQKEVEKIIKQNACKNNAPIYYANNNFSNSNLPDYQIENINTAIKTLEILDWDIKKSHINKGIKNVYKNTNLRGRWEKISEKPKIICDTGHNQDGISRIIKELGKLYFQKLHFIFGTVNDKDINSILKILPNKAIYYFCQANIDRALNSEKLRKKAKKFNLYGKSYNNVQTAYKEAIDNAEEDDLILISGSTFVVAEIL